MCCRTAVRTNHGTNPGIRRSGRPGLRRSAGLFHPIARFHSDQDTVTKDRLGNEKRWVLVSPPRSHGTSVLLARASTPEETSRIGNQTGGRVFLFLHTDDFWRDYREMLARGVKFREEPRHETYGTVAVFEDLYGNKWDLLELKSG